MYSWPLPVLYLNTKLELWRSATYSTGAHFLGEQVRLCFGAFDRMSQNEFIIFNGQKDHLDDSIKLAQEFIENTYENKLNVVTIAEHVNLNARSFLRRFKKATSNTPLEYIQRVRVEAAKKKLESTTNTIMEVMYSVAYNDEKAFRNTFKKYSGLSPKEYQLKYNREMANA